MMSNCHWVAIGLWGAYSASAHRYCSETSGCSGSALMMTRLNFKLWNNARRELLVKWNWKVSISSPKKFLDLEATFNSPVRCDLFLTVAEGAQNSNNNPINNALNLNFYRLLSIPNPSACSICFYIFGSNSAEQQFRFLPEKVFRKPLPSHFLLAGLLSSEQANNLIELPDHAHAEN